ncbi:unnamed protein product, partial [Meganyctiphanes norvegica]
SLPLSPPLPLSLYFCLCLSLCSFVSPPPTLIIPIPPSIFPPFHGHRHHRNRQDVIPGISLVEGETRYRLADSYSETTTRVLPYLNESIWEFKHPPPSPKLFASPAPPIYLYRHTHLYNFNLVDHIVNTSWRRRYETLLAVCACVQPFWCLLWY